MGESDQAATAPQLPNGAPADLQDFFACTSTTATLKNGPLTWISLKPRDLIGDQLVVPDVILDATVHPSLTITPDPSGPGKATVKIGIKLGDLGTVGPELPASIKDGTLTLDTTGLPQQMRDPIDGYVKNLNAWFKKNGKAFAAPAFGDGTLTMSKVALPVSDGTTTVIDQPMTDGGPITPADNLPNLGGSGQGVTPKTLSLSQRQRIEDLRKARDRAEDDTNTSNGGWVPDKVAKEFRRLREAQKALDDECRAAGVPVPGYGEAFPLVDPDLIPPPSLPPADFIRPVEPRPEKREQSMVSPSGVEALPDDGELKPPDLVPDLTPAPGPTAFEPLNLTPDDGAAQAAEQTRQDQAEINRLTFERILAEEDVEDQEETMEDAAESLVIRYKVPLLLALAVVILLGAGVAVAIATGGLFAPSTALVVATPPNAVGTPSAAPVVTPSAAPVATPTAAPVTTPTATLAAVSTPAPSEAPATSPAVAVENQISVTGPVDGTYVAQADCSLVDGPLGRVLNALYPGSINGTNVILQVTLRPLTGSGTYPLGGSSTSKTMNNAEAFATFHGSTHTLYGGTNGSITVTLGASGATASAVGDLVAADGSTAHVEASNLTCK